MAASGKTMLEKLKIASPYNIFYNEISRVPATLNQDNSIAFTDLLCPSLGELKCSLQITSKINIEWLMQHYESRNLGSKPLTILYGEVNPDLEKYVEKHLPNVTQHCVSVEHFYGSHHAKMGIYVYTDNSLRVVVSTSNLYADHWDHFNHGIWVSPRCCQLTDASTGESPTNFKSSLLTYLESYKLPTVLSNWIDYVKQVDFSDVRVGLVTSFPGKHPTESPGTHLQQVHSFLKNHCDLSTVEGEFKWPIVALTSCIGQFGNSPTDWLKSTLLKCLSSHKQSEDGAELKIIYPTYKNVKRGVFGAEIGEGMRYNKAVHDKQKWIRDDLYQWKFDAFGRSGVMAHVKTYSRLSPCGTKMAWFLMTSANLTRGAWGNEAHFQGEVQMRNYEVGVMFLPKFFDEDFFKICTGNAYFNEPVFPVPYDLPLKKYQGRDQPWTLLKTQHLKQKCSLRPTPRK